jgi:hypothetical protein
MTIWPALGTTLAVNMAGTGTGTGTGSMLVIGQILSIDGPSSEVGQVETTHLLSTWKNYRATLPDGGEVSFEIEFDPTDTATGTAAGGHGALKTLAATGGVPATKGWQITYPTTPATTETFNGFLTKLGRSAGGPEEVLKASASIKIDGVVS